MKMKYSLLLVLFSIVGPTFSAEFEGFWKIENKKCSFQDSPHFQKFSGMATIPNIRCSDDSSWIYITNTHSPENVEIDFFDDNSQSYNHRTFHCRESSTLNFPAGLCAGYNYGREGVLKLNEDKSQVFYTESKTSTVHESVGSYEYSFQLEKIDSNKYKITRHLKFWLRPPHLQNTTQTFFLTR